MSRATLSTLGRTMKVVGRRGGRRVRSGYTIVEVMMALCVLAVGAVGVVSLQKVAVLGAFNSRNMARASDVAWGWVQYAQNEATAWNNPANNKPEFQDAVKMPLLGSALADTNLGKWVTISSGGKTQTGAPSIDTSLAVLPNGGGSTLDGMGTDIVYCSQIMATFLGAETAADASGNKLVNTGPTPTVRIDVRTFFSKTGRIITKECNTWGADDVKNLLVASGTNRYEYGFVYLSGTVRRNTIQ